MSRGSRVTGIHLRAHGPLGGFVFAAVHNVQPNVPAANLVAMWEAWREVAAYG